VFDAARGVAAGLVGGLAGQLVMAPLFVNPLTQRVLYDPALQSETFRTVTAGRNVGLSVVGLVLLSAIHGALYAVLRPSVPGSTWIGKGLFWGLVIWSMYWLFQEWFVYVTLLGEPPLLAVLELALTGVGSLCEGLVIALFWRRA
jgi:hypothetical protein